MATDAIASLTRFAGRVRIGLKGVRRVGPTHPMTRALRHFVLLTALLALVPAAAAATSPMTIVRDCADSDSLEGSYSNKDLQKALKLVRGDLAEYSNCKAVISAARGGGPNARKSGAGGAPIDPDLNNDGVVTPRERRIAAKRARAQQREDRELAAIGDSLDSDDDSSAGGGGGGSSDGSSLPMILTVLALVLLAAGAGLWYTAKRNPAVANALRRVPLPGKHS